MKFKRSLAFLLALVMVLSLTGLSTFAMTARAADKQYLSFSNSGKIGWYMDTDSSNAVLELYKVTNGLTGNRISSVEEIKSGDQFIIFAQTGARILHNYQDAGTAQDQKASGATITANENNDIWTFTIGENGGYTITNNNLYLTDEPYSGGIAILQQFRELQISQTTKTEFNVESVPNQSNKFYLTTGGEPIKPVVPPKFVAFTTSGLGGKAKGGWYMSAERYAVRLYKLNGSTGTPASEITSGSSYLIHNGTTHVMNNFFSGSAMQGGTAQSAFGVTESITDTVSNDYWTIKETGNGTYTISPTSYPNYYLNDQPYGNTGALASYTELTVTNEQTEFKITAATDATDKQGTGWFYIYTGDLELPDPGPQETDDLDGFGTGISNMFGANPDNTWVFTGGANVAGGFEQTKGEHNFTRHFEEYIRWTDPAINNQSGGQSVNTLQRYVFNSGAKGRTLANIMNNWQTAVSNYDPKGVLYMAGPEDYNDDDFETHLQSFIDNGLDLRSGSGYVVIMTPLNDNTDNTRTLTESIKEVLKQYKDEAAKKNRIVLVDLYNEITQPAGMYTDGGYLTEAGHYEVGKQLCLKTIGRNNNYPSTNDYRVIGRRMTVLDGAPATFDTVIPTATAGSGSLTVEIAGAEGPFTYELEVEGKTVKGTATTSPFTILGLPTSGNYTLVTKNQNGNNQLVTIQGSLNSGETSHEYAQSVTGTPAETIQAKFNSGEQMTWLFIGDSITHGAQHGHGYDSISELFDKFLEAAGRGTDVVLNVGVSGASAYSSNTAQPFRNTVGNLNRRVEAFSASGIDVATIQLGTNDSESTTLYEGHIEDIMKAIWGINPKAVIVLRTPTAAPTTGSYANKASTYAGALRNLADKYPTNVIYEDQYTALTNAMRTYTWIKSDNQYIFGDATVHPGPVGHLIMVNQFLRACGIYTPDNPITNLKYKILTESSASGSPTINTEDNHDGSYDLTVSNSGLNSTYGEYTLSAKNTALNETFEVTANSLSGLTLTVPNGTYEVTVSGVRNGTSKIKDKTNAATVSAGEFTPAPPTNEDLKQVTVHVTCTNPFDPTGAAGQDFILSTDQGGAQIGNVQNSDGTYTCDVTVNSSTYATQYGTTHHTEDGNQTVTFCFENNAWVATTTTVTVNVTCDTTPELSLETVNDRLTVAVTVDGVDGMEDYTLVDGDANIGAVNGQDGTYTVQVTLDPNSIANHYAEGQEITVSDSSIDATQVTFTYNDGTWSVSPSTVTVSITTATAPTPPTPTTPPATVTPPAGDDDTELPDDDVPMNPTPDDGTDIEDTTPLAPAPEDKGDTDIPDSDTPLDSTPKTGDTSIAIAVLWSIFSLSSLGFVWVVLSMKKSGKHTK